VDVALFGANRLHICIYSIWCDKGLVEKLMGLNRAVLSPSLIESYRALNDRRTDIDRRMILLGPNDPARESLWQALESVLVELRHVVYLLAQSPADHLPQLVVKAEVLATLFRHGDPGGGGPLIPEEERSALLLSVTDDIARLAAG
jgi:hypothetical protein